MTMTRHPYRLIKTDLPISMPRRRWKVDHHECGEVFQAGQEYDGLTVTIELRSSDEAGAVIAALLDQQGDDTPPEPEGKTMTDHVDSTGDDRTANNAARHKYRVLSDAEKAQMQEIKDRGAELIEAICAIEQHPVPDDATPLPDRNLELARQHIEDGVMRAVRHITA